MESLLDQIVPLEDVTNPPIETTGYTITDNTPENVGTTLFGMKSESFKRDLKDLTKGELQRLVRALCFDGMEAPEFGNDFSPRLPPIISLGKALIEAKFIMSINAAMAAQEKSQEALYEAANQPGTVINVGTQTATEGKEVNGETNS